MFTVYSKPNCPFCDQAKALLAQQGLQFEEVVLDVGQPRFGTMDGFITKEELLKIVPNARTMPQILKGTEIIGGFTDLKRHLTGV